MKKIILLFALMSFSLSYAQDGTDWKYLTTVSSTDVYVKIEDPNLKQAWVKMIDQITSKKNKKGKIIKNGGSIHKFSWTVDCESKTYSILRSIQYDKNGTQLFDTNEFNDDLLNSIDILQKDKSIVPETLASGIFNYICNSTN
jgi:hypothetical protein